MKGSTLILIAVLAIVSALGVFVTWYSLYHNTTDTNSTPYYQGTTSTLSNGVVAIRNITYCNIDKYPERMDIYLPKGALSSGISYPTVMLVHGGAWINGSRGTVPIVLSSNESPVLSSYGFIVASIDYFLPPPSPAFPLNIEDVACAVRFLRYSAAQYHIDPNRIGLLGQSAGGHLVSLEALSAMNGTFDNAGQYTGYSSRVEAVVDEFGPANLTDPSFINNPVVLSYTVHRINLIQFVFGGKYTNLILASPVNYVASGEPPFLILQGENDTTVPMIQSIQLYHALRSHGDQALLILVQHAGHGFVQVNPDIPISPSLSQLTLDIINFFDSTLK
jgi:acetyl esterase/lipase